MATSLKPSFLGSKRVQSHTLGYKRKRKLQKHKNTTKRNEDYNHKYSSSSSSSSARFLVLGGLLHLPYYSLRMISGVRCHATGCWSLTLSQATCLVFITVDLIWSFGRIALCQAKKVRVGNINTNISCLMLLQVWIGHYGEEKCREKLWWYGCMHIKFWTLRK